MDLKILPWRSLKTRVILLVLAIFLVGVWSLAFYTSRMLREDMQRLLGEQQFSTSSIADAYVDARLANRLRALEKAVGRITPASVKPKGRDDE